MKWDPSQGEHYAFKNVKRYPPPMKRKRPPFQPWKIDAKKFLIDKVRPHPEWPLICRVENRPAFNTEKEIKEWLAKFAMDSSLYKSWLCASCGKWHHICYPGEVSGSSSGKAFRKNQMLAKLKQKEIEEAHDLDESNE